MSDRPSMSCRRKSGRPSAVDVHVGRRIRERRALLGISQEHLAAAIGLTFQQVQKYERGINRIAAGRLHALGFALDVPVSYFFEGVSIECTGADSDTAANGREGDDMRFEDPMARRETLYLIDAYYAIPDPNVRRRMLDLVRSLVHAEGTAGD